MKRSCSVEAGCPALRVGLSETAFLLEPPNAKELNLDPLDTVACSGSGSVVQLPGVVVGRRNCIGEELTGPWTDTARMQHPRYVTSVVYTR